MANLRSSFLLAISMCLVIAGCGNETLSPPPSSISPPTEVSTPVLVDGPLSGERMTRLLASPDDAWREVPEADRIAFMRKVVALHFAGDPGGASGPLGAAKFDENLSLDLNDCVTVESEKSDPGSLVIDVFNACLTGSGVRWSETPQGVTITAAPR